MAGLCTDSVRNSSLAGVALISKYQQLLLQEGEELQFQKGVLQVQDPGNEDCKNEEEEVINVVADGPGNAHDRVPKMPPLMPASMWTRKDMRVFKDTVKKCAENVIRIGSLATATVSGQGKAGTPWTCTLHAKCLQCISNWNLITQHLLINVVHFSYYAL